MTNVIATIQCKEKERKTECAISAGTFTDTAPPQLSGLKLSILNCQLDLSIREDFLDRAFVRLIDWWRLVFSTILRSGRSARDRYSKSTGYQWRSVYIKPVRTSIHRLGASTTEAKVVVESDFGVALHASTLRCTTRVCVCVWYAVF